MGKKKTATKKKSEQNTSRKGKSKETNQKRSKSTDSNNRARQGKGKKSQEGKPIKKGDVEKDTDEHKTSPNEKNANVEQEYQQLRKRLNDIDIECRRKVEQETCKLDKMEQDECARVRDEYTDNIDNETKAIREKYKAKIDNLSSEFQEKQNKELEQLKKEEEGFNAESDKKKKHMEEEIQKRLDEATADIERYRKKRRKEMEEQIELDVKEYADKRMETHNELVEQFRQKLDLENRNEIQKAKLDYTIKMNELKDAYQAKQADEAKRLSEEMNEKIKGVNDHDEDTLNEKIVAIRKKYQKEAEKIKVKIEDMFQDERRDLERKVARVEDELKGRFMQEQREIERRAKTKKELLQVLSMQPIIHITDEEFLGSKYHYKIQRNNIIHYSKYSTIYEASKENEFDCYCMVTMLNRWSARHRNDCFKVNSRLARYISQSSTKLPFVKFYDFLATENKLYTFMEPLECSKTLEDYIEAMADKKSPKRTNSGTVIKHKWTKFGRNEIVTIIRQVVEGLIFLNNMFIAHMNLSCDNVTVIGDGDNEPYKAVITGLTRAIIYYNVEHDEFKKEKGLELNEPHTEHLPPECFQKDFLAKSVDVYSVGYLLYHITQLKRPFEKFNTKKAYSAKSSESIKLSDSSDELYNLIKSTTEPDFNRRLPLDEVLENSYFRKRDL